MKKYYRKHPEHYRKMAEDWQKNHPQRVIEIRKKGNLKVKLQCLIHYGGSPPKCACCGENNPKFLTIDHIDGGGESHRNIIKRYGGAFYYWLRRNGFPEGYQILCYNCNCGRAKNGGICPHNKK